MSVFIIGATGAGKTTLARRLAEKYDAQHVSASSWARTAFGPPTDCGGDYVEALTAFSRRALRDDPLVCVRSIRSAYDLDSGGLVIEGVRNPHDFHHLFRPERDAVVLLWPAHPSTWATSFEAGGILAISESLQWLVAEGILAAERFVERTAGTDPGRMEAVSAAVLADPFVGAAARKEVQAEGGSACVHRQIPPLDVQVAEEFLYDGDETRKGRLVRGRIFAVSSYRGHLPTFQVLIDGGAVFSYLPAPALWHHAPQGEPVPPEALVYHNCPEHECSVHEFAALRGFALEMPAASEFGPLPQK